MHQFLRAVGFSDIESRTELNNIIGDAVHDADKRLYTTGSDTHLTAQFDRDFGAGIGLSICGEMDESDHFIYDYYFPYLRGSGVSTAEEVIVERNKYDDSFAGLCEELRVGVTLIFYLQNKIPYLRAVGQDSFPEPGMSVSLSALSLSGKIIMPLEKTSEQKEELRRRAAGRNQVIAAARAGDEDAMETLSLYDMDMYAVLSQKAKKDDIYSLVDTSFMPRGVECDLYSILGEIVDHRVTTNFLTRERVVVMRVMCNELMFDVAINEKDLFGEPAPGRRFKGDIWMQGFLNFPNEPSAIDISL